jgi:hypothetical protein
MNLARFHIYGDIGAVQNVIRKIFLDHIAAISGANDEIVDALTRIYVHDVPDNRESADLDHWFGPQMAFLGNASAQAARQDHDFHQYPLRDHEKSPRLLNKSSAYERSPRTMHGAHSELWATRIIPTRSLANRAGAARPQALLRA